MEEERGRISKELNIGNEILYLTREECIKAGPSIDEIIQMVNDTLIAHGKKEYEMPAKIGVHPHEEVFYHAMPAYVPGKLACGCKWIGCYPNNPEKYNLPQTTSLMILNELMTGCPMCVLDGTWITAMRTPAVTVIAANALAPAAETFGMYGCGVQGIEHVRLAPKTMKNLKKIMVYDIKEEASDILIETLKNEVDAEIVKSNSPEEIAKSCEVLSSATIILLEPLGIVKDEWVSKGQTILPCDLNTFWAPETQARADKYIVDSADEHMLFADVGYFPDGLPKIYCETGEVIAGLVPGRESSDELIVCSNIGMSVFDVVLGQAVLTKALDMGLGTRLRL
jgi:ornithine cyclodeaminase/alanine dehydrogenase